MKYLIAGFLLLVGLKTYGGEGGHGGGPWIHSDKLTEIKSNLLTEDKYFPMAVDCDYSLEEQLEEALERRPRLAPVYLLHTRWEPTEV